MTARLSLRAAVLGVLAASLVAAVTAAVWSWGALVFLAWLALG